MDALGRAGFWQGRAPVGIDLWNGTGQAQRASFLADGTPGPSNPDVSKRTVRYAVGACQGVQALNAANGTLMWPQLVTKCGRTKRTLPGKTASSTEDLLKSWWQTIGGSANIAFRDLMRRRSCSGSLWERTANPILKDMRCSQLQNKYTPNKVPANKIPANKIKHTYLRI